MNKQIKSLSTVLYALLFGALIAAATGSPAIGLVFAALKFWVSKRMTVPFGALGEGNPETKTADEIKAEIKAKQEALKLSIEGKAEKSEVDALRLEIDGLKDEKRAAEVAALEAKLEEQNGTLVSQGEEITKLKDHSSPSRAVANLADSIIKAYKDNLENIKTLGKGGMIEIELKAAGTMTITGNYSGGTVGLSSLEPGFTRVQRRSPFLRQLVNSGNITSKYVVWIEQANPDPGAAGMTAEGAAKTQTDFDLVESSLQTRKITAYIKVSKEMLADIPFIEAEIRGELIELIQLKLDEQILSGDNTSNNLKGILEYATAYSAGNFAGTIDEANDFDVLRTAIAQIEIANFMPNYILLNPEDVAAMELTKDLEGRYLMPPFISAGGSSIKGLPIIANNGVTAGDFVVGDFTKSNLRIREDINVQVGYENDDFTKNLVTILAEARAVHFIKSNHVAAFVTGTFSTAIAALETP